MLARTGNARSWHRSGQADIPTRRLPQDQQFGNLPDTLDHPEVIDDWSGGPGEFRRSANNPNAYAWSINMDTRFPGMMVHAQAPQLLPMATYSGANLNANWITDVPLGSRAAVYAGQAEVMVLGNGYIARLGPTADQNLTGSAQFNLTFESPGSTIAFGKRPAIYGSFMYIPNLSGSTWSRRTMDTATYTLAGAVGTVGIADWFSVSGQQMWFESAGRGRLRAFTSPEGNLLNGANLGATIGVGNGFFPAFDALALEDQQYVGMPDGIYQGNTSGTFNNIVNDTSSAMNVENFADLTTHNGQMVGAAGGHIWAFKPSSIQSTLRDIGPPYLGMAPFFGSGPKLAGRFECVRSYGQWLYAGMFTGSGSIFWAGRDTDGQGPYTWYPLHDFLGLNVKVRHLHVDGITTASNGQTIPRRIWASTDASWGAQSGGTAPVFFWQIPEDDANPVLSPAFTPNFMGSAQYESPYDDWQAPGTPKVWRQANVNGGFISLFDDRTTLGWSNYGALVALPLALGDPNGGCLATLSYVIDNQTTIQLPNLQANMYFTASSVPGSQSSDGFEIAWHLDSAKLPSVGGTSRWPIYRSLVGRGLVTPPVAETIDVRVELGRPDKRGGKTRPAGLQATELRGFAEGSSAVQLIDLNGNTQFVKVIGPIEEEEYWQQAGDSSNQSGSFEVIAGFKMAILNYSSGPNP